MLNGVRKVHNGLKHPLSMVFFVTILCLRTSRSGSEDCDLHQQSSFKSYAICFTSDPILTLVDSLVF